MMMKKSRGRNAAKKDKLIDEDMADESRKSKIEVRSKVGDDMSKQDEANSTAQDNKLKKRKGFKVDRLSQNIHLAKGA